MIVLGSRGLTGMRSLVLGSVSHGVANHSRRPVLIIPARIRPAAVDRRQHYFPLAWPFLAGLAVLLVAVAVSSRSAC